ncbi:MAG: LysE/ArgO family amino acid transporter [Parvibaculaceae bacterium]
MATFVHPLVTGFLLGASLIVAIGAQNAFILRQGLAREHVFVLVMICAFADALLITAGVAGIGTIVVQATTLVTAVTILGAIFLAAYASVAFYRATRPAAMRLSASSKSGLLAAITTCLALTFLNPHVYLDTVLLLGSLSTQFEGTGRVAYGIGAVLASFVWFAALGYGARLLQPFFARPAAWRVLDILIGGVMATLSVGLLARVV